MQELSTYHLLINASFFVKLILLLLLSASVASWTIIINRYLFFKHLKQKNTLFYKLFSKTDNIINLFNQKKDYFAHRIDSSNGLERIFMKGLVEYQATAQSQPASLEVHYEQSERAMDIVIDKESDKMTSNLTYLATIGSVSPYVGLLGTVWGIMHSFLSLGNVQQATLSMVAPGIAEALIATAVGLLAAIPAVVSYNYFNHFINRIVLEYQTFQKELRCSLERICHNKRESHV